ncbi:uncharacterized protein MKK02DRAFT_20387 [Dioszegia hungarica]|uniref:Ubiquitin-like domain-containing protein n=1 Tax=Dioszegia hungarica TaxID=4972 RepID=A0AA38LRA8_9TREE|nr:uncharacterized protein MKK02DRAFT_20387 [Dioszegia hungarica]KAI9632323.1 hypothetical protein MKK02DRAFT_20387 [Dioszegia hungarica]
MDAQLSVENIAEERAFVKRYADGLGNRSVEYGADYTAPLSDRPRKVTVIGTDIADPPESMEQLTPQARPGQINLIVKSLKPSLTFPITASLTDPISTLKSLVAASSPSAPSVDSQRLLLKGKALADNKLLKEYDIAEGSTVHLVLKPTSVPIPAPAAAESTGNMSTNPIVAPTALPAGAGSTNPPPLEAGASIQHGSGLNSSSSSSSIPRPAGHGHTRVPSLTITTDVDARPGSPGSPLIVTDAPPLGPQAQVSSAAFHQTVSNPLFWQKIHAICVSEFVYEDDADSAWEGFLVSMKGRLSAGEAALIRDVCGVNGEYNHQILPGTFCRGMEILPWKRRRGGDMRSWHWGVAFEWRLSSPLD